MKNNLVFGIIAGVILSVGLNIVIANTIISSNSVSYQNNKTNETTVEGSLNELFSAVDINERLGDTNKISSIGDGTISGAVSTLNSSVSKLNSDISKNGKIVRLGDLVAPTGTITPSENISNFKSLIFVVNLTGVGVVAIEEVATNFFTTYMNRSDSRLIVGTTLDKMYEADFYYASGNIAVLNVTNVTGVTVFGVY